MTGMARHAAKTSPNKWIILMPQRLRSCLARIKGGHVPQVLHSPWAPQAVSFTCGFACSSLRTLAAELAQQPLEVTSSTEIAEADEQSAGNTAMPATSAAGQLPQAAEDSERVQSGARAGPSGKASAQRTPQLTCDFTMLAACAWELRDRWVPAKVDQVIQADEHSICMLLRTPASQGAAAAISERKHEAEDEGQRDEFARLPGGQSQGGTITHHVGVNDQQWGWLTGPPTGSGKGHIAHLAGRDGLVSGWLWLCWSPNGAARLAMGPKPDRGSAAEAFSFGAQMAAELRGLVLLDVTLPKAWERVVRLSFGPRLSEQPSHHVFLEVMGRHSNVVLTEAARRKSQGWPILATGHQVGALQSSLRQLQTHGEYVLPPIGAGLPPSPSELLDVWQATVCAGAARMEADAVSGPRPKKRRKKGLGHVTVAQALVRGYQGVGPQLAAELCKTAGVPSHAPPAELGKEQWATLFERWQGWLAMLVSADFRPCSDEATGRVSMIGSFGQSAPSVHELVDARMRSSQGERLFEKTTEELLQAVMVALKRLAGKAVNLAAQQAATEEAEATRKRADLLTANLHICRPGASYVEVEDWETGETVTIPLDPAVPAAEAANALYKAARKQDRTGDAVEPVIQAVHAEMEHLGEVDAALRMVAPDEDGAMDVLKGVQDELIALGYMKPKTDAALAEKAAAKAAKARRRQGQEQRQAFRRFTTPGGLQVLVGRNHTENDLLSHEVAAKTDLWFHARGCAGSHTVLRIPAGSRPEDEDVAFAANIAAYYSKARTEGKVPVVKASVADLKKPKGMAPGKVLVLKEKVVLGRPGIAAALIQQLGG